MEGSMIICMIDHARRAHTSLMTEGSVFRVLGNIYFCGTICLMSVKTLTQAEKMRKENLGMGGNVKTFLNCFIFNLPQFQKKQLRPKWERSNIFFRTDSSKMVQFYLK